ncbi:Glyoxalase/Bleomycin resistance protein/Dihydroxybiphenyl dioxygenase [Aspergillus pseudocaelatus]|uniref:Glyoxalase/Bleomycin resistance protein/Dihydroxybiphenyl dioxygenase n=1 Tax=Aspergillus pseudocaelatus TaxID=1825620 RepID=A0ABQ6X2N9_9EURO|nr:Glyoxalase/Bleomycin resistance protein/Dihydroxybiphenyl dioxygenase [Aspergillus pseudocaelatus]
MAHLVRISTSPNSEAKKLIHPQVHNRVINHVALAVCSIEDVIDWYSKIFGFTLVGSIQHIMRDQDPDAAIFGIYPGHLNEVKLAWLVTGNGVGFELFEFLDPRTQPQSVQETFERRFHCPGFFHICVTDKDPESLAARVKKAGGRQVGVTVDPLKSGVECLYVSDPWGNIVEILNVSFEHLAVAAAHGRGN